MKKGFLISIIYKNHLDCFLAPVAG